MFVDLNVETIIKEKKFQKGKKAMKNQFDFK